MVLFLHSNRLSGQLAFAACTCARGGNSGRADVRCYDCEPCKTAGAHRTQRTWPCHSHTRPQAAQSTCSLALHNNYDRDEKKLAQRYAQRRSHVWPNRGAKDRVVVRAAQKKRGRRGGTHCIYALSSSSIFGAIDIGLAVGAYRSTTLPSLPTRNSKRRGVMRDGSGGACQYLITHRFTRNFEIFTTHW